MKTQQEREIALLDVEHRVRRIKTASRRRTQNGWFSAAKRAYGNRIGRAVLSRSLSHQRTIRCAFRTFPALPRGPCGTRSATVTWRKSGHVCCLSATMPRKPVNGYRKRRTETGSHDTAGRYQGFHLAQPRSERVLVHRPGVSPVQESRRQVGNDLQLRP